MIYPIDEGRVNIMRRYMRHTTGINVGCGLHRFPNKINIDVVKDNYHDVDVVADVCDLGVFKATGIDEVLFFEVLEHIEKGKEKEAIKELCDVLSDGGQLLMSVPNKNFWTLILDPLWWLGRHRHYNKKEIRSFFEGTDFEILHLFTAGQGIFGNIVLFYVINWIFKREKVDWFGKRVEKAYDHEMGTDGGGTLFCVARKRK